MPNINIISSQIEPVNNITNHYHQPPADAGQVYAAPTGSVAVGANEYLALQVNIPANINRTIHVVQLTAGASVSTTHSLFFDAVFAAAGTPVTPVNNNWNYADASLCTAKYITAAADPTTGGTLLATFVNAGGTQQLVLDGRIVIPSGTIARTIYVRLINRANQINQCAMSLIWWEE